MISKTARDYLNTYLTSKHEPLPSAENILSIRQQTFNACAPGVQSICDELQPKLKDIDVSGVACLEVTPRRLNKSRENVVLLYFYGGGYIVGSPEEDLPVVSVIADLLGIRAICPRYRLAPEHPYPAAIEDGLAVYQDLLNQLAPDKLLVCGESAGGNLVMQVILRGSKSGLPMPRGIAMLSPWVDLSGGGDSLIFNDGRDPTLTTEWVKVGAELFAQGKELNDPGLSPLFAELPDTIPPTLITSGSRDLLLSHCLCLTQQLRRASIDVELRVWEEMWHVFEWYPELPEARESLTEISEFLGQCLG